MAAAADDVEVFCRVYSDRQLVFEDLNAEDDSGDDGSDDSESRSEDDESD